VKDEPLEKEIIEESCTCGPDDVPFFTACDACVARAAKQEEDPWTPSNETP
jgi:hypothetical protein